MAHDAVRLETLRAMVAGFMNDLVAKGRKPQEMLTDEEAFDVASFINDASQHPRPKSRWNDYPNIAEKPIDFPSGPFADNFPLEIHRLGPFLPIIEKLRQEDKVAYY